MKKGVNEYIEFGQDGKDNLEVEEVDSTGFKCFEERGEQMYRIWAKMVEGKT